MFQKKRGRHRVAPSPSVLAPEVCYERHETDCSVIRLHSPGGADTTQWPPSLSPTARARPVLERR